ncbi:MAG: M20/M25/M40 family metallo-hydrolase [Gemmatimonadaceae bacterium]
MKKILALVVVLLLVALGSAGAYRALKLRSRVLASAPPDVVVANSPVNAERFRQALRFPTISTQDSASWNPAPFADFHEFLRSAYPRVDSALTREVVNGYSLLYTWKGSDSTLAPMLLTGHFDVVPVEPGSEPQWTHAPFAGDTADGMIWGRGAADDKISVIGLLEGVDLLLAQNLVPRRTVVLAFGHDEEVGGAAGAGEIAKLLQSRYGKVAFLVDEGGFVTRGIVPGVRRPVALIGVAEKSSLTVELTVTGTGGHSSMPPDHSALGVLARALVRLEDNQMPARFTPATRAFLTNMAAEGSFTMKFAFANLDVLEPVVLNTLIGMPQTAATVRTTTAVTMASGSPKENVLPIRASAVVNFRILPGDSVQGVLDHVTRTIDDSAVHVRVLGTPREPSPVSSTTTPEYRTLEKTIGQLYPGVVPTPYLLTAATDTRHYEGLTTNIYRFAPAVLTAELVAGAHGTNERVGLADFENGVRFWAQFVLNAQ